MMDLTFNPGVGVSIFMISLMSLGLSAPKMLESKKGVEDLKVAMFLRSEMREDHINLLDAGCGDGLFMPKAVKYFEGIGFIVDKIVGIDNGFGKLGGKYLVDGWNEELFEKHSGKYRIQHMDIKDVGMLNEKFDVAFLIAPYHAYETGVKVKSILEVMKESGIIIISPHWGELPKVEEALNRSGVVFYYSKNEFLESSYALEDTVLIVRRSELRDSKTTEMFSGLLVQRIFETAA